MARKQKGIYDKLGVKGFFRLNVLEHKNGKPEVVGDSGWVKNTITESGYKNFIVGPMIGANSSVIATAALASISVSVSSTATALSSELSTGRFAVAGALSGTKSAYWTGSLNSNTIQSSQIAGVGLFANSTASAGSMAAGNTFTASTLLSNQTVSLTYSITFS
jgi:hypothetical protein